MPRLPKLPQRPLLCPRVFARRHIVDGKPQLVLHDAQGTRVLVFDDRAWPVLRAADGTRDLAGIAAAAARDGASTSLEALSDLFGELCEAGLVVDGADQGGPPPARNASPAPPDRPLEPLPGYRFSCDGRGTCCRRYATIVFGQLEAARAQAAAPEVLGCGHERARAFRPERGVHEQGALAVALVDGHCAFLDDDHLCRIHKRLGAEQKPIGCQLYPRYFVDDGEAVRVSALPECACVLRPAGDDGEPLVPAGARVASELPPAAFIETLPDSLWFCGQGSHITRITRGALRRFSTALLQALTPCLDLPNRLCALAHVAEAFGPDEPRAAAALQQPAAQGAKSLLLHFAALAEVAGRLACWDADWRSERDLNRQATRAIARAAAALCDPALVTRALAAEHSLGASEALYVRLLLFGYRLRHHAFADCLRDVATRVVVARVLATPGLAPELLGVDFSHEQPLALVEAMVRGHGLLEYMDLLA
jgi:lysine-N-methylase